MHASFYVAHFDAERAVDDPARFCYHLNAVLPDDIAVSALRRVRDDAHARFDAVQREYKYYVALRKDPFRRDTAFRYALPLDAEPNERGGCVADRLRRLYELRQAAFQQQDERVPRRSGPVGRENDLLVFTIAADRFLRNMVRAIVGTLLDVGRGKMSPEDMRAVIDGRSRSLSGCSAPAHGLFLTDVKYPDGIYVDTTN